MLAIYKKLAEKAERDRYVVLETRVNEVKRAEKREMGKMLDNLLVKIEKMNQKIEKMEVEQKGERMTIEDIGETVVKMTVDFESPEINEDVKKELREKIDRVEKEKNEHIEEF